MIPGFGKSNLNWNDVMMYLALIGRHIRLMTLCVCFALMLGLTFYVFAKPVYYSRALIGRDSFTLPVDDESVFGAVQMGTGLSSPHVIERACRRMNIWDHWDDIQKKHIKKIKVRMNSRGDLVLEFWPYNKNLLWEFPALLLEEYETYIAEQRAKFRDTAVDKWEREKELIAEKMKEISELTYDFQTRNDLLRVEMDLKELRRIPALITHNTYQLEVFENFQETLANPKLGTVDRLSVLHNLDRDLSLAIGQVIESPSYERVGSSAADPEDFLIVTPVATDRGGARWQELDRERRQLERRIAELSETYLPAHPELAPLIEKKQDVEASLETELEMMMDRFTMAYKSLLNDQAKLSKKLPEYEAVQQKYNELESKQQQLTSGQLAWNSLYTTLARSLTSLEWGADKRRTHFQYLGLHEVRELPVSPHRMKLAVYSLILGIGVAIGLPLLLEYLDHTISHVDQAEEEFQMRALGIVPQVVEGNLVDGASPGRIEDRPDRHLLENFRVIRTNLLANGTTSGRNPQVIMVASALPQEGKSLVAANLALSFAQMGEKTLLIDADLRRGRLHRAFRLASKPGLSHVLTAEVGLDETIQPTKQDNLDLLPYGKHAEGVTELLGTPNFADAMAELRTRYSRIVLDTPPALGLSDTSMMQSLADGVVFVVWSKRTSSRSLKMALDAMRDNGANFYGFVLNRLDLDDSTNYYHYYYYSNYYYRHYQVTESSSS